MNVVDTLSVLFYIFLFISWWFLTSSDNGFKTFLIKTWNYSKSTPFQRVGIVVVCLGFLSLLSWMIKEDLSMISIFDSYNQPRSRDSILFHLYLYLIPLGLTMSLCYSFIYGIFNWVFKKGS